MEDQMDEKIPEMNGTIKSLVEMLSTPLGSTEQIEKVIRDIIKVQLHSYMLQKKILEKLNVLTKDRNSVVQILIDKVLVPVLMFIGFTILQIIGEKYFIK